MKITKGLWIRMLPVVVMIVCTVFVSVGVYDEMMKNETETCWERLENATYSTAEKIKVRITDNMKFLEAVSDSEILKNNIDDVEKVGRYLNSVMESTIFSRIDVMLSDERLITQEGTIVQRGGKSSYDELVKAGTHITTRRTSSFNGREVICCVTAIENENAVIGLLVGTIDCENLSDIFEVFTYGEKAQLYLIDRRDGCYIMDNWHSELGNVYDLGEREDLNGNTIDMAPTLMSEESSRFSYISQTNGEKSYQFSAPIQGYDWTVCVVVQDKVLLKNLYNLRGILLNVWGIIIVLLVLYFAFNLWINYEAVKSAQKARALELERIKNDARAKFISNMSHDVRTPLNGIVGMLQIIRNHRSDEEKVDECLRKIDISTQYLSTLTSDMLDINEIENNKLVLSEEPINLEVLMEEVSVMNEQRTRDTGVTYELDCSKLSNPYIIGSDIHIKRILINLISNAIKYSKNAGKNVWVSVQDEEMTLDKHMRMYHFTIKDNGIGMTEEFQKNMYNAFEQEKISARSDYEGYGLGLTIVNYLVKKMKGDIKLESKKGEGTTFTVSIPFLLDREADVREREENIAIDLSGLNILLVEDNEFNMEVAEVILSDAGAKVDLAVNGKVATEMFANSENGYYNVILMDLMMPVMDGCEATGVIRAMDRADAKTIPIIAMTASAFAEEIKRCKDSGMDAHIAKPLNVNKLFSKIMKYM